MKVQALPQDVINQIAAGEIVERPASILKELFENAMDAGANSLMIRFRNGGIDELSIIDNGEGMEKDDLLLAVKPHTTSKIRRMADLDSLSTFGFRGEALASIASVSRMTLRTKTAVGSVGYELRLAGTGEQDLREAALPNGTEIRVEQLFYNVPARKKFLKSPASEYQAAYDVLLRLAIPAIGMGIKVYKEDRLVLNLQESSSLKERVISAFSGTTSEDLIPVERERGDMLVTGFVGTPDFSKSTAKYIQIYVNGRLIRDRRLQYAVQEAYRNVLMKGRHPFCVLFLSMSPDLVDVNVHPQKAEVRFRSDQAVFQLLHHAVKEAIYRWSSPETGPSLLETSDSVQDFDAQRGVSHEAHVEAFAEAIPEPPSPHIYPSPSVSTAPLPRVAEQSASYRASGSASRYTSVSTRSPIPKLPLLPKGAPETLPLQQPLPLPEPVRGERFYQDVHIIGQFLKTYILGSLEDRLLIIDQHAAYERLTFEQLKAAYGKGNNPAQQLLIPEQIAVGAALDGNVDLIQQTFERLSVIVEPFGEDTLVLRAIPTILQRVNYREILCDAALEIAEYGSEQSIGQHLDQLLISMACHTTVRANLRLSLADMTGLFRDLDQLAYRHHCPHGRPIYHQISEAEIERLLKRTV